MEVQVFYLCHKKATNDKWSDKFKLLASEGWWLAFQVDKSLFIEKEEPNDYLKHHNDFDYTPNIQLMHF